MADCLAGSRVKLVRARKHLYTVHNRMRKYIQDDLVNRSRDPQIKFTDEWQTLEWQTVPAVNPMVSAVLGDFGHNVRSALDHAIYSLVLANGWESKDIGHTQFPILDSEGKWRDDITERAVDRALAPTAGLSTDALQLVRAFQPFTAPKRKAQRTALYALLRLSNLDKHRSLHGAGIVPTQPLALEFVPPGYVEVQSMKHAKEVSRIRVGAQIARLKLRIVAQPPEGVEVQVNQVSGFDYGFFIGDEAKPLVTSESLKHIFNVGSLFIRQASQLPEACI